jgi:hypothetical protein
LIVDTESEACNPIGPNPSFPLALFIFLAFSKVWGIAVCGGLDDGGLGDPDTPLEYPPVDDRAGELLEETDSLGPSLSDDDGSARRCDWKDSISGDDAGGLIGAPRPEFDGVEEERTCALSCPDVGFSSGCTVSCCGEIPLP